MKPHIKYISQYDEGIFSNDYSKEALKLLPGLDMKKIMQFINESDDYTTEECAKTKKNIFNHLQSIYIVAELASSQMNKFNEAMDKQKDMMINMLKNLNLDERLKARVEEITKEEEEEENKNSMSTDEMMKKLGEVLGEDNFVFQLAKDVAEEINMGKDGDTPVDAINMLFANNGQRLQELIVTITEKIQDRVDRGEITPEQLVEHASQMKERLKKVMGDIPEISKMNDPTQLTQLFSESYEKLSQQEQKEYKDIKELLAKPMGIWNDDEKKRFDEFAKVVFSKQAEQAAEEVVGTATETVIEKNQEKPAPPADK